MSLVTTPDEEAPEGRYNWIVVFGKGGKPYTYLKRSIPYMALVVKKFHKEHGTYPHRMWVLVDDEIQAVEIK